MSSTEHRQRADELVAQAQEMIDKRKLGGLGAQQATLFATLALYHQREADRLEGGAS